MTTLVAPSSLGGMSQAPPRGVGPLPPLDVIDLVEDDTASDSVTTTLATGATEPAHPAGSPKPRRPPVLDRSITTLPDGFLDDADWNQAVCLQHDPELWFSKDPDERAEAISFCHTCPLQANCAQRALVQDEQYGVWGGVDLNEPAKARARARYRGKAQSPPLPSESER